MTSPAISRQKLHMEEAVEAHLVDQLVTRQGWRERPFTSYDRRLALDPEMIEEFVRTTQPDAWKRIAETYNQAGEASKRAGIQFAYHNHNFEFAPRKDEGGKLP